MSRLADVDLSVSLPKKEAAKRLKAANQRLLHLRLVLGGQIGGQSSGQPDGQSGGPRIGPPLCVVFEGWDASGKGGAIKRLVAPLDPRHVRVAQFAAPTYDEKRHHFLWRFWPVLPGWGGMAVLDRSWYGRVLVERVEGFAAEEQWQRAYDEIVDFERSLAAEGMILIKFWMHVSDQEQLRRFRSREADPLRNWKLTDEDWRNREKRPQYEAAVEEMLARTDHPQGVWHVVAGDDKRYARVAVAETVCRVVEKHLLARGYDLAENVPAASDAT
jgi:polyphosphate kinase 2 (PPK2 family)